MYNLPSALAVTKFWLVDLLTNATEESVKANKESMQEPGNHGERFKELVQELKLAFLARG